MIAINHTQHGGNLTADPKLNKQNGKASHCYIRIAVNSRWVDRDGNKRSKVTFVPYHAFGKLAEALAENRRKGDHIIVDGEVLISDYQEREQLKLVVRKAQWDGREYISRNKTGGSNDLQEEELPVGIYMYDE